MIDDLNFSPSLWSSTFTYRAFLLSHTNIALKKHVAKIKMFVESVVGHSTLLCSRTNVKSQMNLHEFLLLEFHDCLLT